ncbi:MAG: serine/threonine-protein phosphatase [Planctomycetes bacterium]|nr:serine/threonine-protein phosphatase [Planctomycetota bacterium]
MNRRISSTSHHAHPTPPARRASGSHAAVGEQHRILHQLVNDPVFRLRTVDDSAWIDPYTGSAVPSAKGDLAVARDHLLGTRPWTKGMGPKSLADLQVARWSQHLRQHLRHDARLRIIGVDGWWLEPYGGRWAQVPLEHQRITARTVDAMAHVMARSPEAQAGRLLSVESLDQLAKARLSRGLPPSVRTAAPVAKPPRSEDADDRIPTDRIQRPLAPAPARSVPLVTASMARAKQVMDRMLPPLPVIPGIGLAVHYEPLELVGGDFYDCITLDDGRVLMVVGDVAGHGPEAALTVTATLKALRFIAADEPDLVSIIERLDANIVRDLPTGHFVTLFACLLDLQTLTCECVCAGHHAALLASPNRRGMLVQVGHHGPALGLGHGGVGWRPHRLQLAPGDILVQCTDGLLEAANANDVHYGRLRASSTLIANLDEPVDQLPLRMAQAAKIFAARPFTDDVTVLALAIPRSG